MKLDAKLGKRQMEVAEFIGFGYSIKETADHLNMSVETVKSTLKAVYAKIGIQKATVSDFCAVTNRNTVKYVAVVANFASLTDNHEWCNVAVLANFCTLCYRGQRTDALFLGLA